MAETQITVRCTEEQAAQWKASAALLRTNMSALVREYLDGLAAEVLGEPQEVEAE